MQFDEEERRQIALLPFCPVRLCNPGSCTQGEPRADELPPSCLRDHHADGRADALPLCRPDHTFARHPLFDLSTHTHLPSMDVEKIKKLQAQAKANKGGELRL